MWHESTGTIIYDPHRPGLKKKDKWWCIVVVDREITRYYRWWVQKEMWVHNLCQPSWDAHISVIRGEKPKPELMHLWRKYHGQRVKFKYRHGVRRSGDTTGWDRPDSYWFVDVDAPFLIDIRHELHRPVNWNLHLTIGRTWY